MKRFSDYIEALCREHKMVAHKDCECHFSCLVSDFDSKLQRVMHYPCVGLDLDGFRLEGTPGNLLQVPVFNLYFLVHVKDHGNLQEKLRAFSTTQIIMQDFLARMQRDRENVVSPVERFSLLGSEAFRIEFTDAALYGWMISIENPVSFNTANCNHNFEI